MPSNAHMVAIRRARWGPENVGQCTLGRTHPSASLCIPARQEYDLRTHLVMAQVVIWRHLGENLCVWSVHVHVYVCVCSRCCRHCSQDSYICIYIHTHTYIYIYIYIYGH
jgi:hypothetical protein